jgi:hypothetical protein
VVEHLGADRAFVMFKSVASPSKKQQKLLQDKKLWFAYKARPGSEKQKKATELIHERFRKNGRPVFGVSPEATGKRLQRIQRDRRDELARAVRLISKRCPEFGSPEVIQERLLRIESKLQQRS